MKGFLSFELLTSLVDQPCSGKAIAPKKKSVVKCASGNPEPLFTRSKPRFPVLLLRCSGNYVRLDVDVVP